MSSHFLARSRIDSEQQQATTGRRGTNIPTFIALLGNKLDVVVLLDGKSQRQRINASIAQGRLKASNVVAVDRFCSVKGADIEDLFSPDEYISCTTRRWGNR